MRLRCQEWEKLEIGIGKAISTFELACQVIASWESTTGLDSTSYFDVSHRFIRPKSWFGSVTFGHLHLEVVPQTAGNLDGYWTARFDSNVGIMLAGLPDSTYRNLGNAKLSSNGSRLEALIRSFCEAVNRARRTKVIRRYFSKDGTTQYPRGTLLFPQHIISQIRDPQQFECSWIELSEDVPENQFIKSVLSTVRVFCSRPLQLEIDSILSTLDAVEVNPNPLALARRIRLDRLSGPYASVIELGRDILEGRGQGSMYGDLDGSSQVIISPQLFERYIGNVFSHVAASLEIKCRLQEQGHYICIRNNGEKIAQIIPDIRLTTRSGKTVFVADTKWKFPKTKGDVFNSNSDDVSQVLLYAAKFGARDAALIYPLMNSQRSELAECETLNANLGGEEYRLHVMRLPLLSEDLNSVTEAIQRFCAERLANFEAFS